MLLTVSEFRERVLGPNLDHLIAELVHQTSRNNPEERKAWADSFLHLAQALDSESLASVHLYLGNLGNLSLEYRLPASSSWCDLVLLGNDGLRPSAVILELKHWDTRRDQRLPYASLIDRPAELTLHPSEQVKGYTEYCRHFHSAFQASSAVVNGCVVFTAYSLNPEYQAAPNDFLVAEYPCFSVATPHDTSTALKFLNLKLVKPDVEFAQLFETGFYQQSRSFIEAVGATLRGSPNRRLELLDEQRKGLFVALAAVQAALAQQQNVGKKRVVIVEGPPGSGKSAIAARIWAELATTHTRPNGDLAFVSTSTVQNHGISHLFGPGRGAVKKATQFSPCSPKELGALQRNFPGKFNEVADWRQNFALFRTIKGEPKPRDDAYLVSVVDEAHALVNPDSPDARGAVGFPVNLGPSGYHIIRSSRVSVFLLDGEQGFRDQETTTRTDIERWAVELGAEVMPVVSLNERQFRCGGSTEYIAWVDDFLSAGSVAELKTLARFWRRPPETSLDESTVRLVAEVAAPNIIPFPGTRHRFSFEVLDSPAALEAQLAGHHEDGKSVRLVASYARKWITEKVKRPHALPAEMQDFQIRWQNQSGKHTWTRIWNWKDAPQGYVSWIDPSPGVPMAANPLAEVGCPYTVRGFDYDYLGLLWLNDVVWRTDHWEVIPRNVYESGLKRHRQRAAKETVNSGPHHIELLRKLLQG